MNDTIYPLTLYFDASCPLCRREMNFLVARDRRCRLRLLDVSAAGFHNDTGIPVATLMARMHARRGDGALVSGVEVFRLAYEAVGLAWVVRPLRTPGLAHLFEQLYRLVARHRNRAPHWLSSALFGHGTLLPACRDGVCRVDGEQP